MLNWQTVLNTTIIKVEMTKKKKKKKVSLFLKDKKYWLE